MEELNVYLANNSTSYNFLKYNDKNDIKIILEKNDSDNDNSKFVFNNVILKTENEFYKNNYSCHPSSDEDFIAIDNYEKSPIIWHPWYVREQIKIFYRQQLKEINLNLYLVFWDQISTMHRGNYFHYLKEEITKLYSFLKLRQFIKDLKIFAFYDELPKYLKEFMLSLGINKDDFLDFTEEEYKNFYYKNKGITILSKYMRFSGNEQYTEYEMEIINNLHKKVLDYSLNLQHDKDSFDKKIIILRHSNSSSNTTRKREVINYNEIYELTQKYGFGELITINKTLFEVAQRINYAEEIIIDNGAGCINLFFCQDKAKLILINGLCFVKYNFIHFNHFMCSSKHIDIKNKFIITKKILIIYLNMMTGILIMI